MKFVKKKDYTGTIRKVTNDEKSKVIGIVGTVADLLSEGIFESCNASPETWVYIPMNDIESGAVFGPSRASVIPEILRRDEK
jgi:hypothetical protein